MLQTASNATKGVGRMGITNNAARPKVDPLYRSVGDLRNFSAGMMVLAEMAPERLTAGQLIFFMLAATADIAGKDPTFSDINEAVGGTISKSLHTTYKIFLKPSKQYPNGLGWLEQEANPDDNRVKFLRVTKTGREVVREVLDGFKG